MKFCQTTLYVDAPFNNESVEGAKTVQIIDPRHPLWGKSFPLLSISEHLSHRSHVLVDFGKGVILRIPLLSTNLSSNFFPPCCKISIFAVNELISLAKDCQFICHMNPEIFGEDFPLKSNNESAKTSQ